MTHYRKYKERKKPRYEDIKDILYESSLHRVDNEEQDSLSPEMTQREKCEITGILNYAVKRIS